MQNPKVFISHARKDKERFVLDFAEKLRAKGIDAWVDKWEILPGDSLMDKIFEEGIGKTQAFIVVLSNNSIESKWVKEELNAGMVKKIEKGSRLIPVVIDITDEQVPECLKSTLWERIEDINNYENELDRIVNAIYGHREKPPLGEPPEYVQTEIYLLPNLEKTDTFIFKLACEKAIEADMAVHIKSQELFEALETIGINFESFLESLIILEGQRYIDKVGVDGSSFKKRIIYFGISRYGLEQYLKTYLSDYNTIQQRVGFEIANNVDSRHGLESKTIAENLNIPHLIVTHILSLFKEKGWIYCIENTTTLRVEYLVQIILSPELKRWLRQA
jgi:hypothetical protein